MLFSDSCAPGYDMETEPNGAVPNPILKEWGAGYDLDSYPGGVNFDGVPEFVEKVEAAAADESIADGVITDA